MASAKQCLNTGNLKMVSSTGITTVRAELNVPTGTVLIMIIIVGKLEIVFVQKKKLKPKAKKSWKNF